MPGGVQIRGWPCPTCRGRLLHVIRAQGPLIYELLQRWLASRDLKMDALHSRNFGSALDEFDDG